MTWPPGGPPRRSRRAEPERRVIRVLTEGKKTEPSYLARLGRAWREHVVIDLSAVASGSAPLTLVNLARAQAGESARRSNRDGPDFDEIWCVFDVDDHPGLEQAKTVAHDAGIRVAISNPCFEL